MKIKFDIEHIDSLGQGVSKIEDKITFIQKTLTGEKGSATIYKENSKVRFAKLDTLTDQSEKRITPECPHYSECNSCHFLHTSYDVEIETKKQNFHWPLKKLKKENCLKVVKAPNRSAYRNRMQLHYDKKEKILGQINATTGLITEIPKCIIPNEAIQEKIFQLYQDQSWLNLVKNEPQKGHIEIYQTDKINITCNRPYAHGGFSQVYEHMNKLLKNELTIQAKNIEPKYVIDLFGGSGNLTNQLEFAVIDVIDSTPKKYIKTKDFQNYFCVNLYDKHALTTYSKITSSDCDLLVIDPPRGGLKNIKEFVKISKPSYIFYVSCFLPTLIRDMQSLEGEYELEKIYLFDFFPGTYHFETFAILKNSRQS